MRMIPQDQEFLWSPDYPGDCQRAVIASLLELPIKEVPHFAAVADRNALGFYSLINTFLEARGFEMLWHSSLLYNLKKDQNIYHQISGPSPRGNNIWHAVVGLNGSVYHDPHPSRLGLLEPQSSWRHSFIVKL